VICEEIAWLLVAGFIIYGGHASSMVGKPSPGAREEQNLTHVRRLHQPQQSMPHGPVHPPTNRPSDRLQKRFITTVFPRRLLGLSLDQNGSRGSGEDILHYTTHRFLLYLHAFWPTKTPVQHINGVSRSAFLTG
jgi:hypothetical protein